MTALIVAAIGVAAWQLARRGALRPAPLCGAAIPFAASLLGARRDTPPSATARTLLAVAGAEAGVTLGGTFRRRVPAAPVAPTARLVVAATAGDDPLEALRRRHAASPVAGLAVEAELGAWLVTRFPPGSGYAVLNSVDRGRGDIDHIVVGLGGIWVLETKFWRGDNYFLNDAQQPWRRDHHPGHAANPHAQLVENCAWLERLLARRLPDLLPTRPVPIRGLLIWAHPRSNVWVDPDVCHCPIVRPAEAATIIATAPAVTLTAAQVRRVTALLQPLARTG